MNTFKFLRGNPYSRPINRNYYREVNIRELVNDLPNPENPSYYNVPPDFICVGITPRRTNPITYEPYRHLVYEDIRSGRMTQANIINTEHPMWNYYREIEPEFYNSHYIDRNERL